MKLKSIVVICSLLFCLLPTQAQQTSSAKSESEKLNKLLDNSWEDYLKLNPITATAIGDHRYDDQFPNDISEESRATEKALYAKYLKELTSIERNALVGQDRLSYDTFKLQTENAFERFNFDTQLTPINQFGDTTSTFAQLASGRSLHPFKSVKNYEDFLGRVRGFQIWVDTAIANMRKGMTLGVVQPRILIEKKLPQIDSLLVSDIKQSLFYQPITNLPADFSAADKARLTESYTKAITETIYPAYRKLRDFLKDEYLPKTRASVGLSAIPKGKEEYAFRARFVTTTKLTPDEIHQLGLSEVRRIRGEMEKVKEQVGFKGDLNAFFEFVRTDPKFNPFKTADEVLTAYRAIEARLQTNLPKYFAIVPQAKFEIRQTEKFREAGASEQYSAASPDGSRPGVFYVPIPDPTRYQLIRMESLFLHEAIPGHHYQISLQQEQKNLPKFRQFGGNGAYIEGWGLYTESLGKELGLYTDPYQYFGMLSAEIHRAIRLVVDTGIHSKGWTREQAIKYSLENEPLTEDKVIAEVERYIAIPGQALAYKIGQLKILELRHKSERELGAKFSIRDFHDEILKDGALPLDVLERKINEWIAAQKKSA
ncbi:MAG TPA: DUF885 domain-containing protein [Pyrinomonadaceae bacterium]|nr:DUF885 domain-containing protein [Pyrinomonadaceae bacterium]